MDVLTEMQQTRQAGPASEFVYFAGALGGPIKIGSSRFPKKRLNELQVGHAEALLLLATVPGGRDQERELHERFAASRLRGEWFAATPELLDLIWKCARMSGLDPSVRRPCADLGGVEWADPLGEFLMACTVRDPESRMKSSDLNELFRAWSNSTGGPDWHPGRLKRMMQHAGYSSKKSNGVQWLGIRAIKRVADFSERAH